MGLAMDLGRSVCLVCSTTFGNQIKNVYKLGLSFDVKQLIIDIMPLGKKNSLTNDYSQYNGEPGRASRSPSQII